MWNVGVSLQALPPPLSPIPSPRAGYANCRRYHYRAKLDLKLLSNEVIAKIWCRLKFSATMASRFVEAGEELIEEIRNTSDNKNTKRIADCWTKIFQQWVKTRGKNEQLES